VELLAREYGITRDASDRFALESQQKAERAIAAGVFDDEIAPVELAPSGRPGLQTRQSGLQTRLDADEHPRAGTTIESLQKLPLVFPKVEGGAGIVTAGSSSGITDGGAAVVVTSAETAKARGLKPLVKILGWASAGVDPRRMGIGPVPAVHKLLKKTGLSLDDFDLVELNEAFAAQVLAVLKDLPIPADKLNVNGGAIALGHPIGCTGTRIIVTLIYEMLRRQARRGLATLCVSGGMGMAMAFERVNDE
jgi:acetyl-CoA C-acetyltransferase